MVIHTVKQGQTVTQIAGIYGVPVSRIISDNEIDPLMLVPGQTLVIQNEVETYTVQEGDSLDSVAEKFKTNVRSLLRYNPVLDISLPIYPGQTVIYGQYDLPSREILTNGYAYPFISEYDLRSVLPYLTNITPFTYGFKPNGELLPADDDRIIALAKEYGTGTVMHLSTLTEDGRFSNGLSSALFASQQARDRLISEILENMGEKSYSGLSVDFEYVFADEAGSYADFIAQLHTALDGSGYFLITALAPKTSAGQKGLLYEGHDYRRIGENSDYVFLMTYEWGYAFGPPMAISPINKVREVAEYAVTEIDPEKIFLGLPNYGYDWTLPYVRGEGRARTISNSQALSIAANNRAEIGFDERSGSPYFRYTDKEERVHEVWFEDARFYEEATAIAAEFGFPGFEVWNVMDFNPGLWITANSEYKITDL